MFIGIEVMLAIVGLAVLFRGRFEIGDREVANPVATLVGLVLTAQLPLALFFDIVMRLTADIGEEADANWWIHPLFTCAAVLTAAGITAAALRADDEVQDVYANLAPPPADTPAPPPSGDV